MKVWDPNGATLTGEGSYKPFLYIIPLPILLASLPLLTLYVMECNRSIVLVSAPIVFFCGRPAFPFGTGGHPRNCVRIRVRVRVRFPPPSCWKARNFSKSYGQYFVIFPSYFPYNPSYFFIFPSYFFIIPSYFVIFPPYFFIFPEPPL